MSQSTELTIKTAEIDMTLTLGSRTVGNALGLKLGPEDECMEVTYTGYAAVQRLGNVLHFAYPAVLGAVYEVLRADFANICDYENEDAAAERLMFRVRLMR